MDNKGRNLLMKVLLPRPHLRSLQKSTLMQTHVSGLAWDRESYLLGQAVCKNEKAQARNYIIMGR